MENQGRTILYYPTIDIPTGTWLRQALIYWDQVGSIVPRSYDDWADEQAIRRYNKDIQYLYGEGVFRPFNPDELMGRDNNAYTAFINEFRQTLSSEQFKRVLPPQQQRKLNAKIFRQKVTDEVFRYLERSRLAEQRTGDQFDYFYYYFEPNTALLYMTLLAKFLARIDSGLTITGTDQTTFAGLSYEPTSNSDSSLGLSANLRNLLVVPANNTSFKKILNFKKKHRDQLLKFRSEIDRFESTIKNCEDNKEIKAEVTKFRERIEKDVITLERTMRGSRISTIFGSLQALIKPNSPTLIGTAAVLAGKATSLATVPVEYIVAGAAGAGLIEVIMHLIKKTEERTDVINKTTFSYIYLANKELGATFSDHK